MTDEKTFAKDILGEETLKKKVHRNQRLIFKVDDFSIEADIKYERLDSKKILPFEEYEQDKDGNRVVKKLVGYNRGEAQYFKAIQDDKGKWVADMDRPVPAEGVEKVITDKREEGKVNKKDTLKGLWFVKVVSASMLSEFLIEDTYNFWAEENTDNLLKVYEYLVANNLVGLYKFNPNGTAYHGFLVPQKVNGVHFRLLLQVARVRTNKPEITPTMTIKTAEAQQREKERIEQMGVLSALEEV